MKRTLFILQVAVLMVAASCKKDYTCVCTGKHTNSKTFIAITKASRHGAEKECKALTYNDTRAIEAYSNCILK